MMVTASMATPDADLVPLPEARAFLPRRSSQLRMYATEL